MKTLLAALVAVSALASAAQARPIAYPPSFDGPGFGPADVRGVDGPAFGPKDVTGTDGPGFGPSDIRSFDGPAYDWTAGGNQR